MPLLNSRASGFDEFAVVLSGFGFCVLTGAADEFNFVEHDVRLLFFWFVRCFEVHAQPAAAPSRPTPFKTLQIYGRGPELALGKARRACARRAGVL